jgi:hypothetical protein
MPELRASYEGHQRLGVPHVNLDPKKLQAALDGAMSAGLVGANGDALNYLFPFELWAFRKNCGDALMKESHEWLTTQKLLALMPRQKYPHYVLNAVSSQRAISDTITIDLLRKVEFRRCSRHDCPRVFAVESLHRREYCCQYCAHLESVRKQRLEAKKLRGKK